MDFSHELIMAIMNEGYSDTVMDAARSAGAGGGTVLHAKGTGRARAEKFFGVSLADEKDVVYIVAHAEERRRSCRRLPTTPDLAPERARSASRCRFRRWQACANATNKRTPGRRASGGFAIGLIERAFR